MITETPVREDQDLERLYAQARLHDLLNREQEQEIDARKWAAIRSLLGLLCADPCSRNYLMRWSTGCCQPLPAIEEFSCREQRTLLRRELVDYLPGGTHDHKMIGLAEQFATTSSSEVILDSLLDLSLPATFVVGMAEAVSHPLGKLAGDTVAAALKAWEQHWSPADDTGTAALRPDTVRSLATQIRNYTAARDLFIKHNLRLVYTIAGRNRKNGVAFLDLVQEGNLGLLRAAEKFQFERGYRFSTYAFNWITQGVKRHLADSAGAIRYPSHIQEQLGRVHRERGRQLARSGVAPLDTELAGALGLTLGKTRELLQLRSFNVSLEAPRFEDGPGTTLLDTIPGGPFADPGDEAEQASLNSSLLGEISRLTPSEQKVVIQRWGLRKDPPLTRAEIAEQMSLSCERVRQLEQSAIRKLKDSEAMHALYDDHCHTPTRDLGSAGGSLGEGSPS
jgi:RNA polymerase sigma factor (sigma-70 family)